jgi:hypothetical protein
LPALNSRADCVSYASIFHEIELRAELKYCTRPVQSWGRLVP